MIKGLLELFTETLIPIIVVFGILIGGFILCVNFYGNYQCNNYAEITGKETKHILSTPR
jgi:hypothetical protein